MTPQESQELKAYLDQRFDGVDRRLGGIDKRLDGMDQRLDGIDKHLDRQDIDFNNTTMNLLRTIDDATKESRRYAARLFGILDRPPLDAEDTSKAAEPRRPKRQRRTAAR